MVLIQRRVPIGEVSTGYRTLLRRWWVKVWLDDGAETLDMSHDLAHHWASPDEKNTDLMALIQREDPPRGELNDPFNPPPPPHTHTNDLLIPSIWERSFAKDITRQLGLTIQLNYTKWAASLHKEIQFLMKHLTLLKVEIIVQIMSIGFTNRHYHYTSCAALQMQTAVVLEK